jgi:hypothetical protein
LIHVFPNSFIFGSQLFLSSDPEFIMSQAAELSAKFRSEPEGTPISKFPSMDGSGNDLTDKRRGQVGDGYSRLVPAEYCTVDKVP